MFGGICLASPALQLPSHQQQSLFRAHDRHTEEEPSSHFHWDKMQHLVQAIKLNAATAACVCRYLVKVCTVTLSCSSQVGARLPADPRETSPSEELLADECVSAPASPLATSEPASKPVLTSQSMIQCCLPQHKKKCVRPAEVWFLFFSFNFPRCKLRHKCNKHRG